MLSQSALKNRLQLAPKEPDPPVRAHPNYLPISPLFIFCLWNLIWLVFAGLLLLYSPRGLIIFLPILLLGSGYFATHFLSNPRGKADR